MLRLLPALLFILAIGVLLPLLSPPVTADTGPLFNPATGHWYQAISAPGISWEEARSLAAGRTYQGLRGYLATMTSAEENAWAAAYLPEALEEQHFLGGFQPDGSSEPGGGWQWITGEPWRYTNWGENQPDNSPDEYVLTFFGDGTWNDLRGSRGGYVVEYGTSAPPQPFIAFAPPVPYNLNTPGKVDALDLDGDGHLDLAVNSTRDLAILYGTGDGTFGAPTFLGVGTGIIETIAPDVDRDGKADLITVGGDSVYVYRSTGRRTYSRSQRYVVGRGMWGVHSADWNQDGYPDIAATASNDHRFAFFLNKGDGTFHLPIYYGTGNHPGYITSGDWNRDGKKDLAITNITDGTLSLFRGDGVGGLTKYATLPTHGSYPIMIVTTDFDKDGIADLVVANSFSHQIGILFGNGDGTFQTCLNYPGGTYPRTQVCVDLDRDGDPDIVAPNVEQRSFTVLRNNDGIPSRNFAFYSGGNNSLFLTAGDFNEDGRPDIAVSNEWSNNVSVHLNETGTAIAPTPPAPPTNLKATPASSTQIDLIWTDASNNETSFELERRTETATEIGPYTRIARLAANATSLRNSGLAPSTRYRYRLRAVNTVGVSAYSNQSLAITPSAAPSAPTGLRATVPSSRTVVLQWNDTSNNETGFQVERRGATGNFSRVGTANANATTYTDTVLPATTYNYRLRAVGAGGNSAYTAEVGVVTPQDPPLAPNGLRATPLSPTSLRLDWTDRSSNETGFQIERRETATEFVRIYTAPAGSITFTNVGLLPERVYVYRLRAIGAGGTSAYTAEVQAETPTVPPAAPSQLTALADAVRVQLSWRDNSGNETGVEVERKQRNGAFTRIATTTVNATTYLDGSVTVSVPYTYRVRAVNQGGASAYSNEVSTILLPRLATFTIQPSSVKGKRAAQGTVTLSGPAPDGGAVVTLSSASRLAQPPASVTVPAGGTSATFRITTRKTKKTKTVTLTATYNASSLTASLKVKK